MTQPSTPSHLPKPPRKLPRLPKALSETSQLADTAAATSAATPSAARVTGWVIFMVNAEILKLLRS